MILCNCCMKWNLLLPVFILCQWLVFVSPNEFRVFNSFTKHKMVYLLCKHWQTRFLSCYSRFIVDSANSSFPIKTYSSVFESFYFKSNVFLSRIRLNLHSAKICKKQGRCLLSHLVCYSKTGPVSLCVFIGYFLYCRW